MPKGKKKKGCKKAVLSALALCVLCVGLNSAVQVNAEETAAPEHKQKVTVDKSGGFIIKSQRQAKSKNSTQEATVTKSGGFVIIIQRNINKFKADDLKEILEAAEQQKKAE